MTTLTFPPVFQKPVLLPLHSGSLPPTARPPSVLVFTADEPFWEKLLHAANEAGRKLIRKNAIADTPRTLRLLKPAAVLVDLDMPSAAAWDEADSLLQKESSPPVLLLTSRSDQDNFDTAIQAGSLIDKCQDPARLLQLVELALDPFRSDQRERSAMQRLVIRWLKPCNWLPKVIPLRRFWGINE
jgi:AmiR/NasT family two-component response regulator